MLQITDAMKEMILDIEDSISTIKDDPSQKNLKVLQDTLNKFFTDSKCEEVIYTSNIDKLFFGLYVMPIIPADDVIAVITTDKRYIIKSYHLEIDSKLFSATLNLSVPQLTALLLHDISNLVNDSAPCEEVKKAIDKYLEDNNEVLKLSDSIHYKEILSYGFRDALRKLTTIFEKSTVDKDYQTDEFIGWVNYKTELESAFKKIDAAGYNYNREVDNKFLVLSWVLRLYKDVLHGRIPALHTLERCEELTPSKIEKKELNNLARRLNRIDDDALLESTALNEARSLFYKTSLPLDACKDKCDLIDLKVKDLPNTDEEDVIPDLIHSINNNMTMIDDYVNSNEDMNKETFKQWNDMFKKMAKTRKRLSDKNKMYDKSIKMHNTWKAQKEDIQ